MKAQQWMNAALMTALVALATGCANQEGMEQLGLDDGKKMTITVNSGSKADTRIAYDDDALTLKWEAGDKIGVVELTEDGYIKHEFTLKGDGGSTSGEFEGPAISSMEYIIYPSTLNVDWDGSVENLGMGQQTQDGDNNTAHLKNTMSLYAEAPSFDDPINLSMQNGIMKFVLSGIPEEVGTLQKLRCKTESAFSNFSEIELSFTNPPTFSAAKSNLTAYLNFPRFGIEVGAGCRFIVTLRGDKVYEAVITFTDEKLYEVGKRYTATIDGINYPWIETTY